MIDETTIAPLSDVPFARVHATFQEAFADYRTDSGSVPLEVLYNRAVKNGVDMKLSAGAFAGERLVGITLIGVDRFGGRPSAYDIATGIVPDYRGRKLAGELLDVILPLLRRRGLEQFVLEVLRPNEPAIKAYTAAGFRVTRRFECFALDRRDLTTERIDPSIRVGRRDRDLLAAAGAWIDWEPSWENSLASIARIPDDVVVLGAEIDGALAGLLVYYPGLNWITTIAVDPRRRRRGVASALVAELPRLLPEQDSWKLNNVQDTDLGMLAFLKQLGFRFVIGQFEMSRPV